MNDIFFFQSPIGKLKIETTRNFVYKLEFVDEVFSDMEIKKMYSISEQIRQELVEYFEYGRKSFTVPFKLNMSKFYKKTLNEVAKVKFGKTKSYGQIAKKIDNPKAVRAVGTANSKNPIALIIPCHRIIHKSGKLGGYSAGYDKKKFLLKHEGIDLSF